MEKTMKKIAKVGMMLLIFNLLLTTFAKTHSTKAASDDDKTKVKQYDGMELIFQDEFDGETLDENKWQVRPWPENGTHHYANEIGKDKNIWVEDGELILQAKPYEGDDDFSSTSGHVTTDEKFDFRYGRVDVRAKIPTETGMWPAIWMMPTEQDYDWPMEGEIDIMELISQEPNKVWSTIHSGVDGTDYYFNEGGTLTIDDGTFYDDYHVYSLDWQPDVLRFYMDDKLITEIDDWQNWIIEDDPENPDEREYPTPFDKRFYLKLNLATGGWSEDVDATTQWGERTSMKVDYVRVYQETSPEYHYSTDEPFANGKQGAVWYAQKGYDGNWENFDTYDSNAEQWTTSESGAYVGRDGISTHFGNESNADRATIGFRAPYDGIVKVGLHDNVILDTSSNVPFTITKGNMAETTSNLLRTETITNKTDNLADKRTYIHVDADDMVRFSILNTDHTLRNFDPIVTYVDESEYDAFQILKTEIAAVKDTDTEKYTSASVADFETALENAETYINGTGDENAYKEATKNLTDAFEALEIISDESNATDEKTNDSTGPNSNDEDINLSENNDNTELNEENKHVDSNNNGTKSNYAEDNSNNVNAGESTNENSDNEEGQPLPKTATNMHLLILIGLLFTGFGLFAIVKHRKQKA